MSYRKISWSLEAMSLDFSFPTTLKFDRHLCSSADEMPDEFQSNTTVECRYNAVKCNTIFNTALRWLKQYINQCQIASYNPYLTLTGELWGVFCEDLVENWPRYNGTALYHYNKFKKFKFKIPLLPLIHSISSTTHNKGKRELIQLDWHTHTKKHR